MTITIIEEVSGRVIIWSCVIIFVTGLFGGSGPYLIGSEDQLSQAKISIFSALNCLSGGVLLAAGFAHMLPDQFEDAQKLNVVGPTPLVFAMIGLLVPFLLEKSAILHWFTNGKPLHDIFDHSLVANNPAGSPLARRSSNHTSKSPNYGSTHHHTRPHAPNHSHLHSHSHSHSHSHTHTHDEKTTNHGAPLPQRHVGVKVEVYDHRLEKQSDQFVKLRPSPKSGPQQGDLYRIPTRRGCCNRGEGVHVSLKARCISCKTVILEDMSHASKDCPTVMFPSQSLLGVALQPVRGKKQNIVEDLFVHNGEHSMTTIPYLLVAILSVHSLSAGISFGTNRNKGSAIGLFIAIMCHKAFAGFALGMSFKQNGISFTNAFWALVLFSSMTPLGIIGGYIASAVVPTIQGLWLSMVFKGVAAGTFIYVSLVEILLEEFEGKNDRTPKFLGFIVGLVAMTVLAYYV